MNEFKIPWVRCAACQGRPVERMTTERTCSGDLNLFVECHGDTEEMTITRHTLIENPDIVDAVAFQTTRIVPVHSGHQRA